MTSATDLLPTLRAIVGKRHLLTTKSQTERYTRGFRFGSGPVLAVVRPGSLVEQWRVLQACHQAQVIMIMQAANTGLTGGSTPDGDSYDRPIVLINTLRLAKLHLINQGRQVVCLPGATLFQLEQALRPLNREPHSVIGSSCLGASVLGGVANNSGGALLRRGPAFTQLALFARVTVENKLELVNHLGIRLGDAPEEIFAKLEAGQFTEAEIEHDDTRFASAHDYEEQVRDIHAPTAARFNADPHRLYEASGSAGKIMIFAVRLDSFEKDQRTKTFYIGTRNPDELTQIRRHILETFKTLPVSAEYIHRDAFNIAAVYGKDIFLAIAHFGTDRLPKLFALKAKIDRISHYFKFLPDHLSDKLMQWASHLFPQHLPARMLEYRDRYEHHLLLKMSGDGIAEAQSYLTSLFPSEQGDFFECSEAEASKAFLHRFAVAGAAVRYRTMHPQETSDIVALDIALRRDDLQWQEHLPAEIDNKLLHKLYYGHFFCHVFHQDYVVAKNHDPIEIEHKMWALLDQREAQYPAEHNVGHLYNAKPALAAHYRDLDPCNCFNPGIGKTSKLFCWQESE